MREPVEPSTHVEGLGRAPERLSRFPLSATPGSVPPSISTRPLAALTFAALLAACGRTNDSSNGGIGDGNPEGGHSHGGADSAGTDGGGGDPGGPTQGASGAAGASA